MFKIEKSKYFNLLLCVYHIIYKQLEKYTYDQSKLDLYTYKLVHYKYDKSGLK